MTTPNHTEGSEMKRTKQSTFAKRERSEKSTRFAPVGSEAMIHKHTYSIPSADDQNDARCIECGQLQPTTPHATHTPGPWRIIDSRDQSKATIVGSDFPAMGFVADVNLCRNNTHQQVDGRANAALIAAAPAMYEALRSIPDHALDCKHSYPHTLACWNCIVKAALAQAEGK